MSRASHDPVDAQLLGQGPGVQAGDAGDGVFLEPGVERLFRAGVGGAFAGLADDVAADFRLVGFEGLGGDAVVADEGIGLAEDLAVVGGVGDGFGIADHPRIENDFPRDLGEGAEAFARPDAAVFQDEDRFQGLGLRKIGLL
jgi:hypothetical protein